MIGGARTGERELGFGRLLAWVSPSRLIVIGIVCLYFLGLLALGGHHAWGRLGVPPSGHGFGDTRGLTSGWECTRRGIDVLPANPCDYSDRPANYPRIWMAASILGLGAGSTLAVGLLFVTAFLVAALAVLPSRARPRDAVVYAAAICSPAVMLGVERGNADLLVFAVVALAVLLYRREERSILSHALILFAAVLKLFPIFAAGWLIRRGSRRALIGFAVIMGAFAIYALATLGDIRTIQHVTPQSDDFSYGVRVFSERLAAAVYSFAGHVGAAGSLRQLGYRVWDLVVVAVVAGPILHFRRWFRAQLPDERNPAAQRDLDLFVAGAGIYLCTYVLFRSFDYRLACLLLTLPQLLRWARERRAPALVTLGALFGTLWLDANSTARVPGLGAALSAWNRLSTVPPFHKPLPIVVLAQLILFAGLLGCLVATAPTRLTQRS